MSDQKTAVVLFNLGGPDSLEAVRPFLFNLFNDEAIIDLPQPFRFFLAKLISKRREKKAQKIYAQIGGKSPILETTMLQAHNLEKELSFFGNFKVFVSMRYAPPFSNKVIKEVLKYKPDNLILLPLYPQFSTTTSESSLKDFSNKFLHAQKNEQKKTKVKFVCCYPTQSDFIRSHALLIKQTIAKLYDKEISKFRFLFSAHGLPQKIIDAGDPYVFQVSLTTKEVVDELKKLLIISNKEIIPEIDYQICYQSKVGPLQWTGPSLDFEIKRAVLDKKILVIVPISFISDHSETLVELDIDYKKLATDLGAQNYLRVPALNCDGNFIKSLSEICKKIDFTSDIFCYSGESEARICPKNLKKCPNKNHCSA